MVKENIIENLKERVESLIYKIGKGIEHKELHSDALEVLLEVAELKRIMPDNRNLRTKNKNLKANPLPNSDQYTNEVNKVARRLKRWAQNPRQINSKILALYLKLKRSCEAAITEEILKSNYGNDTEFYKNFPQMKIISSRNHGKIFSVDSGVIEIWEPVKPFVQEYENSILSSS